MAQAFFFNKVLWTDCYYLSLVTQLINLKPQLIEQQVGRQRATAQVLTEQTIL